MTEQRTGQPTYEYIRVDENIELVALNLDRADELFDLVNSNRGYLEKYLPWVKETTTARDTISFIETVHDRRQNGTAYGFGVMLEGRLVGHASLMNLRGEEGVVPEVGYWVSEDASGKGIATQVAEALTELALQDLGEDMVLIRADVNNFASNRIAEKLGYFIDGDAREEDGKLVNYWLKER